MLFVFPYDTNAGFWMKDTYAPSLTIAFPSSSISNTSGHKEAQTPHPIQRSLSTFGALISKPPF